MFVNSPVNLTNVTVFIVSKSTGVTNQILLGAKPNTDYVYNSVDGFGFYVDPPTGRIRFYGQGDDIRQSIFFTDTSISKLYTFQSTGTTVSGWLNGTSQSGGTLTTTRTSTAQGFAIGAEWGGSSYQNIIVTSSIYEILVYNVALTTSQRQTIEGYLAHKWGLTPSLPVISPLSIPGCQMWLDGADPAGNGVVPSNGATVSTWVDKSGNNRNGTSTGSPTLSSGQIVFSGSQWFSGSITNTTANLTAFVVAKTTTSPATQFARILSASAGGNDFDNTPSMDVMVYLDTANTLGSFRNYVTLSTVTTTPNQTFLAVTRTNATTNTFYLNGTASSTVTLSGGAVGSFGYTTYWVGSGPAGANLTGTVSEALYYHADLTDTQRQTIERYLMKKWAIGTNPTIPSIHPFSSIRPHLRAFHPTDIDGCQLWLDAADASTVTLSGSNVTQWIDKSGNGNTVTQTTSSNQPTYVTNVVNGNPVVRFNGTSHVLQTTSFTSLGTNSVSFWLVERNLSGSGGNAPFSFNSGPNNGIVFQNNNGLQPLPNSVPYTSSVARIDFYNRTNTGSGDSTYLNGTVVSIRDDNTTGTYGTTFAVGMRILSTIYTSGDICEILIFIGMPTTSQRQTIEGYLAHKWGLTLYLPVISPLSIPGCQMWLDGADPAGNGVVPSNGATVSTWVDKSGNGYNATAAPSRTAGTYSSSFRAVNFPTSTTGYITNYTAAPTNETMFVVFNNPTSSFYNNILIGGVQGARSLGAAYNGNVVSSNVVGNLNTQVAWLAHVGTYTLGTTALVTSQFTTSTNSISLNGGTAGTGGAPGFTAGRVTYLGVDATNATWYYVGYAMEILFYNSILSTEQRQQIEGYLARKWGISISATLPSLHPFKSIMPATSAHFSPTSITGCQMWLDAADSSVVTIATGVSQWNDKSGNSNNLTQSTTGSQPTYASSLITFANDKYLNIPATVLNNLPTWSLFFVINPISSSNWIMSRQRDGVDSYNILSMTISSTVNGQVQSGSVGNLYWRSMNAGTQLGSSDALATSTLQTCTLTYDGTILYFYKNGELNQATTGSFAIQNQTSPNTYTLGALIYPSGISNPGVTNFRLGEMISYNTFLTTSQRERVEGYLAHKWGLLSSLSSINPYRTLPPIFPPIIQYNIIATGGTIVSTVGTTYHVFRSSSSFVVRRSVTVNYLVVGGGGGGGDRHGGGGGAGGVLSGNWSASAGTYIITVGAGGQYGATSEGGQVAYGTPNGSGSKGGNSVLSGTGISVTANGGGGGGSYDGNPSGTVGSGGGGGGQNLPGVAGTAGQGNAGGAGLLPGGGGGGGAGGVGVAANTGTGGIGTSSFSTHLLAVGYGTTFAVPTSPNTVISGGVAYIAGGGGGCAGTSPGPGGNGGLGGGGRGDWTDSFITEGTPNTGGGGGATRSDLGLLYSTGRNGGSGLVLVWY
jgi:hypothetical protein